MCHTWHLRVFMNFQVPDGNCVCRNGCSDVGRNADASGVGSGASTRNALAPMVVCEHSIWWCGAWKPAVAQPRQGRRSTRLTRTQRNARFAPMPPSHLIAAFAIWASRRSQVG